MIQQRLMLAPGVLIFPVSELPSNVRPLVGPQHQFALTRTGSRTATKLLDGETADLIKKFRQPCRLIDAVIDFGAERGLDPQTILENTYVTVKRLVAERTLVEAESTPTPERSLQRGDSIGPYTIERCIQSLDGCGVYKARDIQGVPVAIKASVSTARRDSLRTSFVREARILAHLSGPSFPRLMLDGTDETDPFIALEWFDGPDCVTYADEVRTPWDRESNVRLLAACLSVAEAYERLHELGVVHGDVHPKNILICNGAARIIDYSFSLVAGNDGLGAVQRAGVTAFYEPEWAIELLAGRSNPPATELSDQYALGAVLFLMLTGRPYLELQGDKWEMFRQIKKTAPRRFDVIGMRCWPDIEALLARTMAKHPGDRFASVADLRSALRPLCECDPTGGRDYGPDGLLEEIEARLGIDGRLMEIGLPRPPYASANYGAAGIAYFFYRLGAIRQQPDLLLHGLLWLDYADRKCDDRDAFSNRDIGITVDRVGDVSVYHSMSGIHCIRCLIANALGDFKLADEALRAFVLHCRRPCGNLDVTLGQSSTLMAAALLTEALRGTGIADLAGLKTLGDETVTRIWASSAPGSLESGEFGYAGIAHGWAGVLFGTLRWCEASGATLPSPAANKLAELGAAANGNASVWLSPHHPSLAASWCNGTAGYVHLWAAANRATKEERYRDLCIGAAEHCAAHPGKNGTLCCGVAGQAYAMLVAHAVTGDDMWIGRARDFARQAVKFVGTRGSHPNSLYKGDVGVALLAADLMQPASACMPLFAPEDWP